MRHVKEVWRERPQALSSAQGGICTCRIGRHSTGRQQQAQGRQPLQGSARSLLSDLLPASVRQGKARAFLGCVLPQLSGPARIALSWGSGGGPALRGCRGCDGGHPRCERTCAVPFRWVGGLCCVMDTPSPKPIPTRNRQSEAKSSHTRCKITQRAGGAAPGGIFSQQMSAGPWTRWKKRSGPGTRKQASRTHSSTPCSSHQ